MTETQDTAVIYVDGVGHVRGRLLRVVGTDTNGQPTFVEIDWGGRRMVGRVVPDPYLADSMGEAADGQDTQPN